MSAKSRSTVTLRRNPDGTFSEILPGGGKRAYAMPMPDVAALDQLSDGEITARAAADPDNPVLDETELARLAVAGRVKAIRARSSASQAVFSALYGIPIGTLRDWEYGRRVPDAAAMGFLRVIDLQPKAVSIAMTSYSEAGEAYEYLKNAADLLTVNSLRDLVHDVMKNSHLKVAANLLAYAHERENDDIPVSNKLHRNIEIVAEEFFSKKRKVSGASR